MLGWSKKCDGQSKAIAGLAALDESITMQGDLVKLVPMNKVVFDQGEFFKGDGKVHIKRNGVYIITVELYYIYTANKAGTAWVSVYKNGNVQPIMAGSTCPNPTSQGIAVTSSSVVRLNKSDYLEIEATTAGVGGQTASVRPDASTISIALLGD